MRVEPSCRRPSVRVIASVLSVLILTPLLSADTFFWTGAGSTSWHSSTSWSGPAGQHPGDWDDTAYVNGATNNPVVRNNHVIGFLVIQNAGHVTVGGNTPLSSLAVTSNGSLNGFTLIKHAGSKLTVRGSTNYRDFQCENLKIQNGSTLSMREEATVQVDNQLILQAGGVIEGDGEFDFSQTDGNLDPYNDGLIHSSLGTLRFYNSAASVAVFDIDGPSEDGQVEAWADSTLIIDTDIEAEFNGTMAINANAELQIAEDWTLASEAGSVLAFFGGTGEDRAVLSGGSATLLGSVWMVSGEASLASPVMIGSTAEVDLAAGSTLRVDDSMVIDAGATFTGSGNLHVADGAQLELAGGLIANLTIENDGTMVVGGPGSGTSLISSFEQGSTGRSEFHLCTGGGEPLIEQLIASGGVTLDGELNLTALAGCEPLPGDAFTIISATSVTGTFATTTGLPDVEVIYAADSVTVRIPTPCPADLDGSGGVDVLDIIAMLGAWGANPGDPADLNSDDVVNVFDLLELLAAWGSC